MRRLPNKQITNQTLSGALGQNLPAANVVEGIKQVFSGQESH
jgi:hypothetical protein